MDQKYLEIINKKILQAVSAYCKLNNIEDVDDFIKKCFQSGFNIEKYGLLGKTLNEDEKDLKTGIVGEKQVIKEVIVEKIVEVPVEVIKEVEKVVTKIEYISDKTTEDELGGIIAKLKNEMSKKDLELDELNEAAKKSFKEMSLANRAEKITETVLKISNLSKEIGSDFYILIYPWPDTLQYGQKSFNWVNYSKRGGNDEA